MVSKYNTERKYREGQENRKEIFKFVEDYIELHGYFPSNREIEETTGLSKATVQRHMKKFELDGANVNRWIEISKETLEKHFVEVEV